MPFSNWILDIREGNVGGLTDGETIVDITDILFIIGSFNHIGSLIEFSIILFFKIPII